MALSRQAAPPSASAPAIAASPGSAVSTDPNTIDGFAIGRADISPANLARLQTIAARIQATLKDHPDSKVLVVGHTDAQGNEAGNAKLGMSRAESTRDALVKMGIPAKNIQTESMGQSEPVDDSGKKDDPRNRRAVVHFDSSSPASPPKEPWSMPTKPPEAPPVIPNNICLSMPDLCKAQPLPGPRRPPQNPNIWKPVPPAPKGSQPRSVLDVLNQNFVDPVVKAVTQGLPKDIQQKALDLAHAGVLKGVTGGLGAALGAAGVNAQGQTAILKAVEAALKEKGQSGQ
jgi:hypothetical protein